MLNSSLLTLEHKNISKRLLTSILHLVLEILTKIASDGFPLILFETKCLTSKSQVLGTT